MASRLASLVRSRRRLAPSPRRRARAAVVLGPGIGLLGDLRVGLRAGLLGGLLAASAAQASDPDVAAAARQVVVTDPAGRPVEGALVVPLAGAPEIDASASGGSAPTASPPAAPAAAPPAEPPLPVRTDTDGRAALDRRAAAACVRAGGYRPERAAPEAGRTELAVVLRPAATVAGRVTDTSGAPVAGAPGVLDGSEDSDCAPEDAVTGADGTFAMPGLGPGSPTLRLEPAAGHLPSAIRLAGLRAGETRRVDVTVLPAARVVVAVAGADGKPLRGAEVRVLPEWGRHPLGAHLDALARRAIDDFRAETDGAGAVALPPLPVRHSYRVAVRHEAHAPRSARAPATEASSSARVQLGRGGAIALRAVNDEGGAWPEPVGRLVATGVPDLDLVPDRFAGDADGRLALSGLPPGEHALLLRAPGARPRVLKGLVLTEGARLDLGPVVLLPGAAVAGRVETTSGAPVADVLVRLSSFVEGRRVHLEETTDAEGRFRFEGLEPEARVKLRAAGEAFLEADGLTVLAGAEDVVLTLAPAASLEVTARDRETGEAVDGFSALARPAEGQEAPRDRAWAEDGRALLRGLPPGLHGVLVEAPGYLPALADARRVVASEEPQRVEVELARGLRLEGRVLDAATGEPVRGARVLARLSSGGSAQSSSNGSGDFVLEGLEDTVPLEVAGDAHVPWKRPDLDVRAQVGPLEIRLERGGSVAGLVLDPAGEPLPGARVNASEHRKSATSDASGWYELAGLPPGRVALSKVDGAGGMAGYQQAVVLVPAGGRVRHDFGAGPRLSGVLRHDGEPAAGARMSLTRVLFEGGAMASTNDLRGRDAVTRDDGTFSFADVESGPHVVYVNWQDRRFFHEVDVPAGVADHAIEVDVPDLVVGGVVRDAVDGHPLPGADVTASPHPAPADGRLGMMMVMRVGEEEILLTTDRHATDETGPDGRFRLLLPAGGQWRVTARAGGYRFFSDEPFLIDVQAARDDVALDLEPESATRALVRLSDARTGRPIGNGLVTMAHGRNQTHTRGGGDVIAFTEAPAGEPVTFVGSADGLAFAVRRDVVLEEGETAQIELALAPGGALRLHLPPDALRRRDVFGLEGALRIVHESGLDLMRDAQLNHQYLAPRAEDEGGGTWLFRHLASGHLVIELGEGEATRRAEVDVLEDSVAEVDLR